jgi:hypothetical protein
MSGLLFEGFLKLAVLSAPLWVITAVARGPVSRLRVERFASRHDLIITPANGGHVIRYLATTRRWRAAGLGIGYAISVGPSLWRPELTVNFVALLASWFAGALIAETRVAQLARGSRPTATLIARSMSAYLSPPARVALPVALGLSVTLTVTAGIRWVGNPGVNLLEVAAWLAGTIALAGLVRAVQQRVFRRPQPPAPPDFIAADDAVRSRSLHVLAGAGATLVVYCGLGQLYGFDAGWEQVAQRIAPIIVPAVAILGWWLSAVPWRVRRMQPDPRPVPAPDPSGG